MTETVWELPDTQAVRNHRAVNEHFTMPCGRYGVIGFSLSGKGVTLKSLDHRGRLYRIEGQQRLLFVVPG